MVVFSHIATAKHAFPTPAKIMTGCAIDSLKDAVGLAKQSHSQLRGNKVPQSIRSTIQSKAVEIRNDFMLSPRLGSI